MSLNETISKEFPIGYKQRAGTVRPPCPATINRWLIESLVLMSLRVLSH